MKQRVILICFVLLFVAGCAQRRVVVVHEPAVPAGSQVVYVEPPPPRVETRTTAPGADHVWIPGYWMREGNGWTWVGGHWELRPRSGASYVPGHWQRSGNYWLWVPGQWK